MTQEEEKEIKVNGLTFDEFTGQLIKKNVDIPRTYKALVDMKESDIRKAYRRMREVDETIPDEVLDFMKDAAIEKLNSGKCAGYLRAIEETNVKELVEALKWLVDYVEEAERESLSNTSSENVLVARAKQALKNFEE